MSQKGPHIANSRPNRSMGEQFRAKAAFEAHRINGNYRVPGADAYLEDIADQPQAVQQQIYESTRVPWVAPPGDFRITSTSIERTTSGDLSVFSAQAQPQAELTFTASTSGVTVGFARNGTFSASARVVLGASTWGSGQSWAAGDVFVVRLQKTTVTIFQNGVVRTSATISPVDVTWVAGFRSDTPGQRIDLVTFLPIPVVWWDVGDSAGWTLGRFTATHNRNTSDTIVFQSTSVSPCSVTWTLASTPGAFTVGIAPVGGPQDTIRGTELQFSASNVRQLQNPALNFFVDLSCAAGDTFTIEQDTGTVQLYSNTVNVDVLKVSKLTEPVVAQMTSERAGDAIRDFLFETVIPPQWRGGVVSQWTDLTNSNLLAHTAADGPHQVVANESFSNASFEFTVSTGAMTIGFTQCNTLSPSPGPIPGFSVNFDGGSNYTQRLGYPASDEFIGSYASGDTFRLTLAGSNYLTPYLRIESNSTLVNAFGIRDVNATTNLLLTPPVSDLPQRPFVAAIGPGVLSNISLTAADPSGIVDWEGSPGISQSNGTVSATTSGSALIDVNPQFDGDLQFAWHSGNAAFRFPGAFNDNIFASISGGVLTVTDFTAAPPIDLSRSLTAGDTQVFRFLGNANAQGTRNSSVTVDQIVSGNPVRWFTFGQLPTSAFLRPVRPLIRATSPDLVMSNVSWIADGTGNPIWTQNPARVPWHITDGWVRHVETQDGEPFSTTLLSSVGEQSNVAMTFTVEITTLGYLNVGIGSNAPTEVQFSSPASMTNTQDRWCFDQSNWQLQNASGSNLSGTQTSNVTVFGLTVSGGNSTQTSNGSTVLTRTSVHSPTYQIQMGAYSAGVTLRQITVSATPVSPLWQSPTPSQWSVITRTSATSKGSLGLPPLLLSVTASSGALGFSATAAQLTNDPFTSNWMGLATSSNAKNYQTRIFFSSGVVIYPDNTFSALVAEDSFTVTVSDGIVRWQSNDTLKQTSNVGASVDPLQAIVTGVNGTNSGAPEGDRWTGLRFPDAPTPVAPQWRNPLTNWDISGNTTRVTHIVSNSTDTIQTSQTFTTGRVQWQQSNASDIVASVGLQQSGANYQDLATTSSTLSPPIQILRTPVLEITTISDTIHQQRTAPNTNPVSFFITSSDLDVFSNIVVSNVIPSQWVPTSGWTLGNALNVAQASNNVSTLQACNCNTQGAMVFDTTGLVNTWVGLAPTDVSDNDPTLDRMSIQVMGPNTIRTPNNSQQNLNVTPPLRLLWGADTFTVQDANQHPESNPSPIYRGPLALSNGDGQTPAVQPQIRSTTEPIASTFYIGSNFEPQWIVGNENGQWTHTPSNITQESEGGGGLYRTLQKLSGGSCRVQFNHGSVQPGQTVRLIDDEFTPFAVNLGQDASGWAVLGTSNQGSNLAALFELSVSLSGSVQAQTFRNNGTEISTGLIQSDCNTTSQFNPRLELSAPPGTSTLSNLHFVPTA